MCVGWSSHRLCFCWRSLARNTESGPKQTDKSESCNLLSPKLCFQCMDSRDPQKKNGPRRRKTNIRFLPRPPCFSLDATFPQVGGGDRHSPPTPRRRPPTPRGLDAVVPGGAGGVSGRQGAAAQEASGARGELQGCGGARSAVFLLGCATHQPSNQAGGLRGWGGGSGGGPSKQPTK